MPYAELLGDLPQDVWYVDHEVNLADGGKGRLDTCHRIDHESHHSPPASLHRHRHPPPCMNPPNGSAGLSTGKCWLMLEECGFQLDGVFSGLRPEKPPGSIPDCADFDGILTYHATSIDGNR
jgi:hypothetical protein